MGNKDRPKVNRLKAEGAESFLMLQPSVFSLKTWFNYA